MKSSVHHARRALVVIAAVALASCSVTRPSPVKQTFLLDPPLPAAVAKGQPSSLRMGTVNVGAPFRGRSFVSREGEFRYENDFYNEFLVAPASMIGELTGRALEHAKAFSLVAPANSSADADWILDGFVTSLYADAREPAKMYADVDVTYYLFRNDGTSGLPVWTQTYRQRTPLSGNTAQAYASALNVALGTVFADLARDLAAANLPAVKR